MRLYAVRDRLIDYFMKPFTAENDKQVMAMVAETINNGGNGGIQQAPHHFEIWVIAEITETGHVDGSIREFLADCGSLVRATPGAGREPAHDGRLKDRKVTDPAAERKGPPERPRGQPTAEAGAVPRQVGPAPERAETGRGDAGGGHTGGPSGEVGAYPFA